MIQIEAIIYSYKNKNLPSVVKSLIKNTKNEIKISVFDQHPLDRSKMFDDSIEYNRIFWDVIQSPCEYRGSKIEKSPADYILQLSDDAILSPGWDEELIQFINNRDIVVSGHSVVDVKQKDIFSIFADKTPAKEYSITNYIDRNFVFASRETWNSFKYPYFLKYNGEEEMLSLALFMAGKEIYCAPYKIYDDLNVRTIENLYVPFSKDHSYNLVVDALNSIGDNFLAYHSMPELKLLTLPYATDDVDYNPYALTFQEIDARKFISKTKAIY